MFAEVIFHLPCLLDNDIEAYKEICRWLCENIVLPKDTIISFQSLIVAFTEASLARTCDTISKDITLPFNHLGAQCSRRHAGYRFVACPCYPRLNAQNLVQACVFADHEKGI